MVHIANERPVFSVPLHQLRRIVLGTGVDLSSTLICKLAQHGIALVCINPRNTQGCALTTGLLHNDATRRLRQYAIVSNEQAQLLYAKELVRAKLTSQIGVLNKALAQRPDLHHGLTTATRSISATYQQCQNAGNLEQLNGFEGAAASAYFKAYCALFAPRLLFTGRNRRPPKDPVNVILSLTYTLLHAEAVRVLHAFGFDPALGFYHKPAYGRESLACDLMELIRARADVWIWQLFRSQTLVPEHFSMEQEQQAMPCMLGKRGREIFYMHYQMQTAVWQRQLRFIAKAWLANMRPADGE